MAPIGGCAIRRKIMITFIEDESGATAIEYGLALGLVTGVVSTYFGMVAVTTYITDIFSVI